jgi:hypothetical protein
MMMKKYRLVPLYLLLLSTLGTAALSKLADRGSVPDWFQNQFRGTVFDLFSGSLAISYYSIALIEGASAAILLISLCRGEGASSRASQDRPFLHLGLWLAQINFAALAFGQRLTHQYDQAFELFAYAALVFLAERILFSKERITA